MNNISADATRVTAPPALHWACDSPALPLLAVVPPSRIEPFLFLVQPIAKKLRLGFRAEQTCSTCASRCLRGRRRLCGAQLAPARAVRGAAPPARLLVSGARRWRRGHAARTSREWALCRSRRVAGSASTRFGRRGGAPCRLFAALGVAQASQWSRQPLWPVWAGWGRVCRSAARLARKSSPAISRGTMSSRR